ncbi:MAG TPA: integrase core domain-containing protein [Streptosporangiaceae bacterium]
MTPSCASASTSWRRWGRKGRPGPRSGVRLPVRSAVRWPAAPRGRPLKWFTLVDEYTRQCLALEVGRGMTAKGVSAVLAAVVQERGVPAHIRSDNGPEFIARAVRAWMLEAGMETLYIEPGAPWENGYAESFNSKVRDELLNAEEFTSLLEARVLGKAWKQEYNHVRPHSALGYRTPAEFGEVCPRADSAKPPPARGHICDG